MNGWRQVSLFAALVFLVFIPRLQNLDAFRSPDEDRWAANTNGFVTSLAHGEFTQLVKLPHPGITTQWLGALTIRYDNWTAKKLPLIIGQSLLILVAGYVFGRLWGKTAGVFTVLTLAANPLLYAHTRVYAMDSLLALFSVLALGFLLLWHEKKSVEPAARYLVASAFCTAAAILSKMSGVALLPIIGGTLLYWCWAENKLLTTHYQLQTTGVWLVALILSSILILPTLAIHPLNVLGDMTELFRSGDYQDHHLGQWYYFRTLIFFSAPIHWLAIISLTWLAWQKKISRRHSDQLLVLLLFAFFFFVQMTLGSKKGDRYILPSFVILDVVAAFVIAKFYQLIKNVSGIKYLVSSAQQYVLHTTKYLLLATLAWQVWLVWQTHPHTLAYINPITKSLFGERRHGWGEGLDLAATYLNNKPNAANLKMATYYSTEASLKFKGETVPIHQHDNADVDYVVLYRAMLERGPDAWETDVVKQYRSQKPEHIIYFQGVPFVWLYAVK